MFIKTIVPLIIILLLFTGCTSDTENTNDQKPYTINIPEEWTRQQPTATYDAIYTPDTNQDITFSITKPETLTIGQAINNIAEQLTVTLQETHTSFTLLSSNNIDVRTVSAYELVYTYEDNNLIYQTKHVPIKDKDTLYQLIYIAPENSYDHYIEEINQAIYSFRAV